MAFIGGVAVAVLNDWMSRAVLKRNPAHITYFFVIRQIFNVAYLAALFFLASALSWNMIALLAGGALGVTLPAFFFARRLVKLNDAAGKDDEMPNTSENETGKTGR